MKLSLNSAVALAFAVLLSLRPALCAAGISEISSNYVTLAERLYSDSLVTANRLSDQVNLLLKKPTKENLARARRAWREARAVYSQSEVFRFGNPVVDAWETQVNAWPLDEGFIDYVDDSHYFHELGNPVGQANIINSKSLRWGPNELDLSVISPELLASLNELGGTEANVATGWHAIEFLLWGQDLNGTNAGAGQRPASDFSDGEKCTNNNCDRRGAYLRAVTELLVTDLETMVDIWNSNNPESYAQEFLAFNAKEQIRRILYGMGSLALGELAGERMKVALLANSTEDEHDCFSDDTHSTLFNNAVGIDVVLRGGYTRSEGETFSGPSLLQWAKEQEPGLATALQTSSTNSLNSLSKIVKSAESGTAFDQLIAPGNQAGAQLINDSIDALKVLTRNIELLAAAMKIQMP